MSEERFEVASARGEHHARFHGSWYRGEHTNFIPSKAELRADDAVDKFLLYGWLPPEPFISKKTRVTVFGSCSAATISHYLSERSYSVLGGDLDLYAHIVRFGAGMANSFAIRQQLEWALGEREIPENLWFGAGKEIASLDPVVREQSYDIINATDAFIITLGLSEIWYDRQTGEAFWRAIPSHLFDERKHGFRQSTVEENFLNLEAIRRCIRRLRPEAPVVFVLAPVPLMATFRPISCLTANAVSKAVLRVAIDQLTTSSNDPNVHYFPFYEIVHEMFPDWRADDNRHAKPEAVEFVMRAFERHYCRAEPA